MRNHLLRSPKWLRVAIRGGTAFAAAMALLSLFMIREAHDLMTGLLMSAIFGSVLGYFTYRGYGLCKFLNHEAVLTDSMVRITSPTSDVSHPIGDVRFKFEDGMQILSIVGPDREVVFRIDYVGQDIQDLKNQYRRQA